MIVKRIFIFTLLISAFLFTGCSQKPYETITSLEQLENKKVGAYLGYGTDLYLSQQSNYRLYRYDTTTFAVLSLKSNKISSFIMDAPSIQDILDNQEGFAQLPGIVCYEGYGVFFPPDREELRNQCNTFIRELRGSEVYSQMEERWFTGDLERTVMPEFVLEGEPILVAFYIRDTVLSVSYHLKEVRLL